MCQEREFGVSTSCVVCGVGPIKGKPRSGLCKKGKDVLIFLSSIYVNEKFYTLK